MLWDALRYAEAKSVVRMAVAVPVALAHLVRAALGGFVRLAAPQHAVIQNVAQMAVAVPVAHVAQMSFA